MSYHSWICFLQGFHSDCSRLLKYAEIISSELSSLTAFTLLAILFAIFCFMNEQTHSTPGILSLHLKWIIFSLSKYAFTRHLIKNPTYGTFHFVKVSIVRSSFFSKSTERFICPPAYLLLWSCFRWWLQTILKPS